MGDELAAEVIELEVSTPGPAGPLLVLKHDDLFAVFDTRGDFYGDFMPSAPAWAPTASFKTIRASCRNFFCASKARSRSC